jgi:hypothetical protein
MPALRLLFLTLFAATPLFAQFGASLQGTVQDQSGAVISGATVTLTQAGNQTPRNQTSSAEGFYRFSELPPGSYTVVVSAANFKSSTSNNVAIAAETPRSLDVKLTPGGASETVTVNANDTSGLQTSDATISGTIDSAALQRIPTFGQDPYELLRTAPGITGDGARSGNGQGVFLPNGGGPGQSNSGIFQSENQVQISADGQRTADNNFLIDGVSVNSLGYGGAAVVTPNLEAVGQITVVSTSYSAEDGRNTGAQIKTVTKSGSNDFHGGGVFLYDQPGLNAYNRYGGPLGQLPTRVGNQARTYLASIGGPIVKNKVYFFLSYQGFTQLNQTFPSQYIETPEFRQFIASSRPNSIASAIVGAAGSVPRVAKILPATCATPVDLGTPCQVLPGGIDLGSPIGGTGTYVPGGQAQSGGGLDGIPDVQYVQLISPSRSRGNQFNARGDWTITPRDQLTGSFYLTKLDNQGVSGATGSRPNADLPFKPLNQAYTAIYIHTFSPSLLNELRGNFTRFAENGVKDGGNLVNWGVPYINVQNMNFDSINDLNWGVSQSQTSPAIFAENTYEVRDTVTKSWGSHTVRAGVEYRIEQDNNNLAGASRPVYAFAGIWSFANDTPIYEGITANPNSGGPALSQRYFRDHYWGLFVQHDWKATPNLTLNAGIRWEYFEPLYNQGFKVNYPVLGPPGQELTAAYLTPRNHLWNSQWNNYSPKVGFAYTPPGMNNKVVLRGGFALAYNRLPAALFANAAEDGPNYLNYGLCCATDASGTSGVQYGLGSSQSPFSYAPNPFLAVGTNANGLPANGAQIEVYGGLADTKTPYSYLYSFEAQRELPEQWVLTVGYQGSLGRHYSRLVNQNFLYNQTVGTANTPFSAAYFAQTDSVQSYNALNLHGHKSLTQGVTFDIVYTYSKSLDQVSNGDSANANGNQTDPAHNNTEYGPSDYDVRNRVVVSGLWDLPKAHSGNALVKAVANGWQINGLYTWHDGFPFTPVTYQLHGIPTLATAGTIGPVRPLGYYGGLKSGCDNALFRSGIAPGNITSAGAYPAVSKYFNITPPANGAGTNPGIGRNSFRGPCYVDMDMSFAKEQSLEAMGHNLQLRFQANFFNIFNQETLTPFSNGNANQAALIESATFGQAQSANAGRVLEFLVRLQF